MSIPKYVGGIHGCTTQAFPGATIGRLSELVSSGRINLRLLDFVIIHVGTNNISSPQSVNTIMSYYGDLIHKLKNKTSAKLLFTSIIPRLVDHLKTVNKVHKVNSELRKYFLFCNFYKSYLYNNSPDPTLFSPKDGLHLNV